MNCVAFSTWFQVPAGTFQQLSNLMKVTVCGFQISVPSCSFIFQSEIAVYKIIKIPFLISFHLKYQATGHQELVFQADGLAEKTCSL